MTIRKEDTKYRIDNDDIIVLKDESHDSKKKEMNDTEKEGDIEQENRNEKEKANK